MHPTLRRALAASAATALGIGLATAPAAAHHRPGHQGGPPGDLELPEAAQPDDGDQDDGDQGTARVVVGAIDSGVNAYHEFFHAGGDGPYAQQVPGAVTDDVLAEFGIGEDQILSLTRTGDQEADREADRVMWDAVEPGVPYWFEGTNVIGISFAGGDQPLEPTPDKSSHGTGVASSVLEANPEAVVVAIEGINSTSEEWAFTHPSTDVITTSYGPIGSPPLPFHLEFSYTGVVGNGKVHTGAVDNTPALSPVDSTGGPWWSIGVAGYEEGDAEGRQMVSGSLPDLVGDFTQSLPYCTDCQEGRSSVSGTSFATPTTAGVVSRGILEARRAAGHVGGIVPAGEDGEDGPDRPLLVDGESSLTNWELRRALEEAAVYPSTDEWDPAAAGVFGLTTTPVFDPAPWSTMGWGLVTADPERGVVDELLARLEVAGEPTRQKGEDACAWMTAQIELRYTYWNTYAVGGESFLTDDDPYVRC